MPFTYLYSVTFDSFPKIFFECLFFAKYSDFFLFPKHNIE